jgi:hypothetical protein
MVAIVWFKTSIEYRKWSETVNLCWLQFDEICKPFLVLAKWFNLSVKSDIVKLAPKVEMKTKFISIGAHKIY